MACSVCVLVTARFELLEKDISYSSIIAFSSNLRLRLAASTSTSTFCYVVTRLRTLLLHWIVVHATTIVMNSKDLSLNLLWYSITWSSNHLSPRTVLPLFLLRFGLFATSRILAITVTTCKLWDCIAENKRAEGVIEQTKAWMYTYLESK